VKKYPISVAELVEFAPKADAPREIIDLYSTFPTDTVFTDRDDLTARSEVITILESQDAPEEQLVSPEEY
ncbi:MAG: hypothetical protein WD887_00195, partial [Candidatus Saccharimonadales bacterium]